MGLDPNAAHAAAKAARDEAEAIRVLRAKLRGSAPTECGPDVVAVAPARGLLIKMKMQGLVPDPKHKTGYKFEDTSYRGRSTIRSADVFDRMAAQVKRRGGAGAIPAELVDAGRAYRDLSERVASAGVKCSSAFDAAVSGGGGGDFMDAYTNDSQMLAWAHQRIGLDVALEIKRRRPSKRGGTAMPRQNIQNRMLVDMVCISDKSVSEVLTAYGWNADAANIKVLRGALCRLLERLRGG